MLTMLQSVERSTLLSRAEATSWGIVMCCCSEAVDSTFSFLYRWASRLLFEQLVCSKAFAIYPEFPCLTFVETCLIDKFRL